MYLDEYTKITIENFKGLYKRGMSDQCPPDHAICCQNCNFTNPGEFSKRGGVTPSLNLNHIVVKQYLATFENPGFGSAMITLDDAGNLYQNENTTPIYTLAGMYDFHLLNIFNRVYILPITDLNPSPNLLVWDAIHAVREAGGLAPTSTFTAADGAADPTGGLDPGVHLFAVCYVTNTGFTTPPGPKIMGVFTPVSYTAPGATDCDLSSVPTGPSEVVQRIILATKANELEYFFVPNGVINDNTTTTITLNFFDTNLVVSADYLFDILERIPCQDPVGTGAGMLAQYHARQVIAAGRIIRLSRPQEPEAFDNVNGYINVPANTADNVAIGVFVLRDILYITQLIGILATQDNLDDPGTWDVIKIDGAITAYKDAISTVASNVPALGISEVVLLGHREGIFVFNGTVQRPEITWKIKNVWDTLTRHWERNIMISVDVFAKLIYVIFPSNNSTIPNVMVMADYSEGIDRENIKWTYHFFPFVPLSIGMAEFADTDGLMDVQYYLRIGAQGDNTLYKLKKDLLNDDGEAIDTRYCCYLSTVQQGAINIFRALRFRARGAGDLDIRINSEDFSMALQQTPALFTIPLNPALDYTRQINFMNEKMSVQVSNDGIDEQMQVDRIDIWAKNIYQTRPGQP